MIGAGGHADGLAGGQGDVRQARGSRLHRKPPAFGYNAGKAGDRYSAVVGSMIVCTRAMLLTGKPPRVACLRMVSSSGEI